MIEIIPLSAFNDNYIWLIKDYKKKQCVAIDPGDAAPVLDWLADNSQWKLTNILITHHHADHTGGIIQLKQATSALIFAPDTPSITKDYIVKDDQIQEILGLTCEIFCVPGHTLDHIVYFFPAQQGLAPFLFSGDTLFFAGCGRIFEGTAEQMYYSLQKLSRLPKDTSVYCAHEYTLSNLRFAMEVEPDNIFISELIKKCTLLIKNHQPTIPSTLALEHKINPFLRCTAPSIINSAKQFKKNTIVDSPLEVFTALREFKNVF